MEKTLYYLRHGQTEFNREGIWQGRSDSPLSSLGIQQARVAGEHIRRLGIEVDHVFRSPLGRVAETLKVADPSLAEVAEIVGDLVEMSFGRFDGTPIVGDPCDYPLDYFASIGGEHPEDAAARTCSALEGIMMRPNCDSVLVAGHGTTGRFFFDSWAAASRARLDGPLPNGALLTYSFDAKTRSFCCRDIWAPC